MKKEILKNLETLPKYMENEQPIDEPGRFVRLEDVRKLIKNVEHHSTNLGKNL